MMRQVCGICDSEEIYQVDYSKEQRAELWKKQRRQKREKCEKDQQLLNAGRYAFE